MLRICHILSNIDRISFGVWNAALFGHEYLRNEGVETTALVCTSEVARPASFPNIEIHFLGTGDFQQSINQFLEKIGDASSYVFVSHGCWLTPSRVGNFLRSKGYKWVYVPHGMLEPWSMQQGRLKKRVYYYLFEKKYALNASRVRAVSKTEQQNLERFLKRDVDAIENGVPVRPASKKDFDVINFLFLGRLHFKKGILPLVKAWHSTLGVDRNKQLIIAGPDEGELGKIKPFLGDTIRYVGALYGKEKAELLAKSHYFLLPSLSEGFPVSVLEGMSYGLIPLISSGCNFNEVFTEKLGYRVEPDEEQISSVLRSLPAFDQQLSLRNIEFINRRFSEASIAGQLLTFYRSISR